MGRGCGVQCVCARTHILVSVRVCADGGANICHRLLAERRIQLLPHCVCGDMDSVTDAVRNDFNAKVEFSGRVADGTHAEC